MKNSFSFSVAAFLALTPLSALAVSWSNCADASLMDVTSVTVSPDPVRAGAEAVFKITGDHEVDITGGTLKVSVEAFGMNVYNESGPLCSQQDCPLLAGTSTLSFSNDMPSFLPSSTYTTFEGVTDNGDVIFCTKIKL